MESDIELLKPDKFKYLLNLEEKNEKAQQVIRSWAQRHAMMDIAVGAVSWIPGASIPALITSLAAQVPVIYQPMTKELAGIYNAQSDGYTDTLNLVGGASTVALEFGTEFIIEIAQELLQEAGWGVVASLVPGIGAIVAASLDYLIANMMTWRVGTMTAIYFQNEAKWVSSRRQTFEFAKEMTGGLHIGLPDLRSGEARKREFRVDLNEVPRHVPSVLQEAVSNLGPIVKMMAGAMTRDAIKRALTEQRIPAEIIDIAIARFCY